MGMGRVGMELGIAPRLLQPNRVGWLGKSLSSAELLVSPAACEMGQPSRVRWQLGLSSAELSPSQLLSREPSGQYQAVGTEQSSHRVQAFSTWKRRQQSTFDTAQARQSESAKSKSGK